MAMSLRTLQPSARDQTVLVGVTGQKEKGKKDEKSTNSDKCKLDKENDFGASTHKSNFNKSQKRKRKAQDIVQLLVNPEITEDYWKDQAEERRVALEETSKENEIIKEENEILEVEIARLKELKGETEQLIKLLAEATSIQRSSTVTLQPSANDQKVRVVLTKGEEKQKDEKSNLAELAIKLDKENSFGDSIIKSSNRKRKWKNIAKGKQGTAQLLINPENSVNYWRDCAEQRRIALEEALKQNEMLKEEKEVFEVEKTTLKELIEEAEQLIELLAKDSNEHNNTETN